MKKILEYDFPKDIKEMDYNELSLLAVQIREFLLNKVSKTGGHLASNLGIVELTISLHKVFDSPKDKFIFDVGHQSYVHKILTGRAKEFDNLREYQGISGFPKSKESIHDQYDTGHSSTSISALYGMAKARDIKGENYNVIAIIGDGSMTGGQCFEALNNIGASKTRAIVILNDNGMSISKNVGGLSKHLATLRTSASYINAKNKVRSSIYKIPKLGHDIVDGIRGIKNDIKYTLIGQGVLFEELGFTYLGPVDGHNIKDMCDVFNKAKTLNQPVIIHVNTIKGKGYYNAEKYPAKFHGIGPFDIETGKELKESTKDSYSKVAGSLVYDLASKDRDIVAITAAMGDSVGLTNFSNTFKERYFDVGIAEQHAVSFSAGLAKSGLKPYVFIYSSFLQRGYDQIIEDVCLQNLDVTFMIDRAGLVGKDGETHNGIFDLSYLLSIPNISIFCPYDKVTLNDSVKKSYEINGPVAIRYPRGEIDDEIEIPKNTGSKILLLPIGRMVNKAIEIKETIGTNLDIINLNQIKPCDLSFLEKYDYVITLEDNVNIGGFGEYVGNFLVNSNTKVLSFSWPDEFIPHGNISDLEKAYCLDVDSINKKILEFIK